MAHDARRHTFFFSILLAGIVATPLAVAIVAVRGMAVDPRVWTTDASAAIPLVRTFIAAWDLLALALWIPCAAVVSVLKMRLERAHP